FGRVQRARPTLRDGRSAPIPRGEATAMIERPPARSSAAQTWHTCAEWAEVAWLAARRRGMADPVVELWALDQAEPGRGPVGAADRGRTARKLAPCCSPKWGRRGECAGTVKPRARRQVRRAA